MSVSHKSQSTQVFRMMLYRRPLHPELFDLHARRTDRHGEYEVETWICTGGHLIRFQVEGQTLTEALLDKPDHLPETGLVHAIPVIGEKDYEMKPENRLGYVTTLQTESLTDNLYNSTYREMQDFARETGSLSREWQDADGCYNLAVLDTQKYRREFHVQSYHLVGATGLVLRTQTIFEIVK